MREKEVVVEVAQSKEGVVISQRKFDLDILEEIGMTNCRPIDSPMDPNQKGCIRCGLLSPAVCSIKVTNWSFQAKHLMDRNSWNKHYVFAGCG